MIAAGSGLAVAASPVDAALEASLAALAEAGRDHVDLALVFVCSAGDSRAIEASARPPDGLTSSPHALLHAVRRVTGARVVVGASGAGVLTDAHEVEGQTAVAVLAVHDPRLVATPALIRDQHRPDLAEELATALGPTFAEGGCLLALPDTAGLDPRALLQGIGEALGAVPVTGGVAAGMPSFALYNTDEVQGALVALGLSGAGAPVVGVAQGCEPIGEPYVITRAEGNVIHQIGSRRATDVLRDAVRSMPDAAARVARAGVFAGLAIDPAKSPLARGDFLVRNLLGADQASGALAVGESVHVGQTLQFQIRDAAASRADLGATLDDMRRRLGDRRPAFGCYFNCAGRGQGLFGVADHDVTLIRERLGAFPLAGFFGNGELAPVGGRNFFHTYTGVLVVVPAPAAER